MEEQELQVLNQQKVLGKNFIAYGTVENPLFLAKDVAEWIEHSDVSTMLRSVDEDEKVSLTNPNNVCGGQNAWFLTENGLYEVLMLSRKPIAKQFKAEVKKILHRIRMTGGYNVPQTYAGALRLAADLQEQVEKMTPKAAVYDRICNADGLKSVEQVSANLGIGKNTFFALMRGMGIFFYSAKDADGRKTNLPKREYVERGYFVTREEPYIRGDRELLYTKIYVTGKGETWLADALGKREVAI